MSDEDKIKPAEIEDEELNEAQGGLRIAKTGIRATDIKLNALADTIYAGLDADKINASFTKGSVIEFQDGEDLFLRKRPSRTKL